MLDSESIYDKVNRITSAGDWHNRIAALVTIWTHRFIVWCKENKYFVLKKRHRADCNTIEFGERLTFCCQKCSWAAIELSSADSKADNYKISVVLLLHWYSKLSSIPFFHSLTERRSFSKSGKKTFFDGSVFLMWLLSPHDHHTSRHEKPSTYSSQRNNIFVLILYLFRKKRVTKFTLLRQP